MSRIGRTPSCLVALLLLAAPGPSRAADCGDLNENGDVTTSDALLLLRFAVGQSVAIGCPVGLHCWDANADGSCDASEDVNGDTFCDVADCKGLDASEQGLMTLSASLGFVALNAVAAVVGDDETAIFTLPFTFRIDNVSYGRIAVSTNGWMQFLPSCQICLIYTAPASNWINTALPAPLTGGSTTSPFLAVYWDDLAGQVLQYNSGAAPNRTTEILFAANVHGAPFGETFIRAYVRLHEGSNLLQVGYQEVRGVNGDDATIGFQAAGGSSARAYPLGFNAAVLQEDPNVDDDAAQSWSIAPVR